MAHFGIVCPPIPGHVNPLATLGRALIQRGHRVTVFHIADLAPSVRLQGLEFIALGSADFPEGTLAESVERMKGLSGRASLQFAVEAGSRIARLILEHGPEAMKAAQIDALLVDQNEPAGGSVAQHLGIPFISICTSLPLNRGLLIPPPFVGWNYSSSVLARLRNGLAYLVADRFIAPIQATLNEYRQRWGLRLLRTPDDSFSALAQIAQMPEEFDFPHPHLPSFHYTGPWFDAFLSSPPFPFGRLDGRPLIYGSLGTIQSSNSHHFQVMAEACAGLEAQLVLSLGAREGSPLPVFAGDPITVNYAPQVELLKRAALTITHAGMNTTMQALHFGSPVIAVPLTHDQPAIAARLQRTGAGLVIDPKKLTPARLRSAVSQLLPGDSRWRGQAHRMQEASRQAGGVGRAADIVETVVLGA